MLIFNLRHFSKVRLSYLLVYTILVNKHLATSIPKQISHKFIGLFLLEAGLPYETFKLQYTQLLEGLNFTHKLVVIPQTESMNASFLNQFQSIVLSGGEGHVSERKDLSPLFNCLQKYMKSNRVIGFCLAYQMQVKCLGGRICGDYGHFKRYLVDHVTTQHPYTHFLLYMAHQYFFPKTLKQDPNITPLLECKGIPNAAFKYCNGIFTQAHPECLPSHVEQSLSPQVLSPLYYQHHTILKQFIQGYLSGISFSVLCNDIIKKSYALRL